MKPVAVENQVLKINRTKNLLLLRVLNRLETGRTVRHIQILRHKGLQSKS